MKSLNLFKVMVLLLGLVSSFGYVYAQESPFYQLKSDSLVEDSIKEMSIDQFFDLVKTHHPVAQQAQLVIDQADARVLEARGGFDPKFFSDYANKSFDEKNYFRLFDVGVKIPTWFGPELKGGFEQGTGDFINPQNLTPDSGLWYAGITVPVGQGLFIDKRRAQLRSGKIFRESSEFQKTNILNELLLDAGETYWKWTEAYGKLQIIDNALTLAVQRFNAVKQSTRLGDNSVIDTVEANVQVQIRQVEQSQARLDYQNATAELSVFLWLEGSIPLELDDDIVPKSHTDLYAKQVDENLIESFDTLMATHPILEQGSLKIKDLAIERRLRKDQLKPVLNLTYTPIIEAVGSNTINQISQENVKFGLNFEMPLLLRKERGKLQSASLKIKDAELELINKSQSIYQKASITINEWKATFDQSVIFVEATSNYSRLYRAEQRKFEIGESSLFLVNSRENSFINAQTKQLELVIKNRKTVLKANYAFGVLANYIQDSELN